jgi:hypothetical protein
MNLTPDEEIRILLLSDGELYHEAVTFVRNSSSVESKQMTGLWQYSRSWDELYTFVKHQHERDWGESGKAAKAHYKDFYQKMGDFLKNLQEKTQTVYKFIPEGKLAKDAKEKRDYIAGLLAREFIQHLVVEMLLKESKESSQQERKR